MIVFKQKEYAVGAVLSAGLGALSVAGTGAQMIQSDQQSKEAKEQSEAVAKQMERQNKALEKIARRAGRNPEVAQQALQMVQRNYSGHLRVKRFAMPNMSTMKSLFTWQNVKGLGKDVWGLAKANKERLIKDTAMGAAMGTGAYGVNKAIEFDKKRLEKQGQAEAQQEMQRSYSIMSSIGSGAKTVGGVLKNNWKSITLMGGGMSALPAIGYMAERNQIKDQAKQTELQKAQGSVLQKEYSWAGFAKAAPILLKKKGVEIANSTKNFFKAPVKNTLSGTSTFMGMGGEKGAENFANTFANSKNSELSQAIGKFAKDHKKTTLAGATVLGGGLMSATWGGGEKAVRKTAEALDPNAFAYEKSKEEMVQ